MKSYSSQNGLIKLVEFALPCSDKIEHIKRFKHVLLVFSKISENDIF